MNSMESKLINYEVVPGVKIGDFVLGTPLPDIIRQLENENHVSEILYDEIDPMGRDIMIKFKDGILLRFEPKTQRLKLIEIFRTHNVNLIYDGSSFSGGTVDSTFLTIYQLFGPTYPGRFDLKHGVYHLSYPGLSFVFPVPEKFRKIYANNPDDMPIRFPDNTTPTASKVYVYKGRTIEDIILYNPNPEEPYFQEIFVTLGESIYLSKLKKWLKFHDSTQEILMKIGKPDEVFYKKFDKLRIHVNDVEQRVGENQLQSTQIDYFYNYFDLGLDIMFDGNSHQVKKFILHTNLPGSKDFNRYKKANFKIDVKDFGVRGGEYFISQDLRFSDIQKTLRNIPISKPLVNNSQHLMNNPFGGTKFYSYRNCIFEVLKNGFLNSVCLYKK